MGGQADLGFKPLSFVVYQRKQGYGDLKDSGGKSYHTVKLVFTWGVKHLQGL
jgi:hypothetical protein